MFAFKRSTTMKPDFEEIYVSYFSKMKYFAQEYVVSEEDAENIVQDVFTELWEKRDMLTCHINLIAFLFASIKNRCIDYLRHKVVVQEAVSQLQEEHAIALRLKFDSLEAFDQRIFSEQDIEQLISRAIDTLPDKCKEIFLKSKFEGKKQKEIAAELNISINTIETQMSIAYKRLKVELKDYLSVLLFLLHL